MVAARLVELGATLIDADMLAREAVAPGTPGLDAIVTRWGTHLRRNDGTLDRAALRQIVFSDPADRGALDAIVHPEVERRRQMLVDAARTRGDEIVVCDIPLLFEKNLQDRFGAVMLVDAPVALRAERLVRNRRLTPAEAQAMIDAQLPSGPKRERATWVIDNTGSLDELRAQVDALWPRIRTQASALSPLPPSRGDT